MIDSAERRSFIFGITLTEVLVLFVFLLALLIGGNMEGEEVRAEAERNMPQSASALRHELTGSRQRVFEAGEKLTMLQNKYQQLVDENAALRDLIKSESRSQRNPEHEAIFSALAPLMNPKSMGFLQGVVDTLSENPNSDSLIDKTDLLTDLLNAEESDVAACENLLAEKDGNSSSLVPEMDIEECRGRLMYFEKTYAEGISDVPPPCWISPRGRSQSLFSVRIDKEGFEVSKAWGAERKDDAAGIDGALTMVGKKFNSEQFLAATERMFEQSRQLQCRHVVNVYDGVDDDKDLYKSRMKIIEARFYKNLRG